MRVITAIHKQHNVGQFLSQISRTKNCYLLGVLPCSDFVGLGLQRCVIVYIADKDIIEDFEIRT